MGQKTNERALDLVKGGVKGEKPSWLVQDGYPDDETAAALVAAGSAFSDRGESSSEIGVWVHKMIMDKPRDFLARTLLCAKDTGNEALFIEYNNVVADIIRNVHGKRSLPEIALTKDRSEMRKDLNEAVLILREAEEFKSMLSTEAPPRRKVGI